MRPLHHHGSLLAGLIRRRYGERAISGRTGFFATVLAETMQMAIILLVARPFQSAWELVQVIGLPMILANSLFMAVIRSTREQRDQIEAQQAHQALQIANRTLPFLRNGLSA